MPSEDSDVDHCLNTEEANLIVTATFCDLTKFYNPENLLFFKTIMYKKMTDRTQFSNNYHLKSYLVFYKANLTIKNNYTIFSQNS